MAWINIQEKINKMKLESNARAAKEKVVREHEKQIYDEAYNKAKVKHIREAAKRDVKNKEWKAPKANLGGIANAVKNHLNNVRDRNEKAYKATETQLKEGIRVPPMFR